MKEKFGGSLVKGSLAKCLFALLDFTSGVENYIQKTENNLRMHIANHEQVNCLFWKMFTCHSILILKNPQMLCSTNYGFSDFVFFCMTKKIPFAILFLFSFFQIILSIIMISGSNSYKYPDFCLWTMLWFIIYVLFSYNFAPPLSVRKFVRFVPLVFICNN